MKLSFGKKKVGDLAPAKKTSRSGTGIGSFSLINFLVVLFVTYLCAGALFFLQGQQTAKETAGAAQGGAEALAKQLSARMEHYRALAGSIAGDPDLAARFAAGDEAGLRQTEAAIGRYLPEAMRIRLLPVGWNELDEAAVPPLSYASLDILRMAERSKKVTRIEAHQFGTKGQHFALAAPVLAAEGGEVVGLVHIALPLKLVQQLVDALPPFSGRAEVQQGGGADALALAASSSAMKSDLKGGRIPVSGSIWEVAYWKGGVAQGMQTLLLLFGVPTVGLLIIGALFFLQNRRLRQLLKQDQGAVVYLVEGILKGKGVGNTSACIKELGDTMASLAQLERRARSRKRSPLEGEQKTSVAPPEGVTHGGIELDDDAGAEPEVAHAATDVAAGRLPDAIFRAYDIRGVVATALTPEVVHELGRAIGSEVYDKGQQTVIVARDGRSSSEALSGALARGLQESGREVLDLGMVPVSTLYFATHFLGSNSGVMVTGSHNPPEYNGLKIVINGEAWSGAAIKKLRERVETGDLLQGEGSQRSQNLVPDYIARITSDVQMARPLKVVVDCGNGVAGVVAPALLRELGCEVTELFCEVDGRFPNHHPDPGQPENLAVLISTVQAQEADLGVAFDGDGDRLGVVDSSGNIIWPDRLLMLFAADVLTRQPGGDVLYDVKSTRNLAGHVVASGGRPVMWKTGHSLMKAKMKETGALLAGEMSGHIFFKERWFGFDDALYATARLLEILAADARSSAEVFAELPDSLSTPELVMPLAEGAPFALVQKLLDAPEFPDELKRITIDGLRVEFQDGWGLVRASNTNPAVTFRFEADDEAALERIKALFRQQLSQVEPGLALPF
jgi:phosphomannomutase/phosphoglucomutase